MHPGRRTRTPAASSRVTAPRRRDGARPPRGHAAAGARPRATFAATAPGRSCAARRRAAPRRPTCRRRGRRSSAGSPTARTCVAARARPPCRRRGRAGRRRRCGRSQRRSRPPAARSRRPPPPPRRVPARPRSRCPTGCQRRPAPAPRRLPRPNRSRPGPGLTPRGRDLRVERPQEEKRRVRSPRPRTAAARPSPRAMTCRGTRHPRRSRQVRARLRPSPPTRTACVLARRGRARGRRATSSMPVVRLLARRPPSARRAGRGLRRCRPPRRAS